MTLDQQRLMLRASTGSLTLGGTIALAESAVTNLTTDLAAKAPLASPTFTGTPAADTASAGTNTTQLATTAFVTTAVAGKESTLTFSTPLSCTTNTVSLGTVPVANGGTGSATQNFVDLTTDQTTIAGKKTFSVDVMVNGMTVGKVTLARKGLY